MYTRGSEKYILVYPWVREVYPGIYPPWYTSLVYTHPGIPPYMPLWVGTPLYTLGVYLRVYTSGPLFYTGM